MMCALSRWLVSRAEDTGRKLPRFVERHLGRCPGCGAFVRASRALGPGLRSERPDFLAKVPEFAVDLDAAASRLEPARHGTEAVSRRRARLPFGLRPLPVAAAALLVMATAAVVFFQVNRPGLSVDPQQMAAARAAVKSLTSAPQGLGGIVGQAESSLDRERQVLEKSLFSAVDYLQARLNITVERKDRAKSL
jgi:hypothetical protein